MNTKILLIFVLGLPINLLAQTIQILDFETNKPIEYVTISSSEEFLFTDKNGEVDISELKKKNHIELIHTSYKKKIVTYKEIEDSNNIIYLTQICKSINNITVGANRWEQNLSEVPVKITFLDVKNISKNNPQTTADLLGGSGEIFIQKSQMGGGSPMIRGFAANRILIVVDGVRMNNAIYRSGNLQNVISIDPNSLQQAEIILGPGSVIYGSDAIGGVMDFHTKIAQLSTSKKLRFTANYLIRNSTVNNEKTGHIDFCFGLKKIASITSFTYSDFGDLKMGNTGNEDYTRPEYVSIIDGKDSIIQNSNSNIQKSSAYKQFNVLQKFRFKPNKFWNVNYSFHYSESGNVPRYDRLTQYKKDILKYAEWYYGPQKWIMNNISIENKNENLFYDVIKLTVAYQDYSESRHDRKLNKEQIRKRYENVKLATANIDFDKKINQRTNLFYGVEAVHNTVYSDGVLMDINTNETETYASRYPDGSTYASGSVYSQLKCNATKKLTLNSGIRYNYVQLKATLDTSFYQFPFTEIENETGAISGSVGIAYNTEKNWQFNINLSTGFRAPNIDDVGKVFDSEPGNVVVPNPDLKPEYVYSTEFSVTKRLENVFLEAVIFYSFLDNAMVRGDFDFNQQDSIMYDETLSKVEALVNTDEAIIYGGQLSAKINFLEFFKIKTNYTYTKGYDKEKKPLRHVSPNFGATHLYFENKKFYFDLYSQYNSEISFENLAGDEADKPHLYAKDNNDNPYSPWWWTVNYKMSIKIKKYLNINFGIENILNHRYRPYSSGIVAPGRNFIFTISGKI